ncbi:MAG: hydrolase [Vulcanimicrobiaceae bacterium]
MPITTIDPRSALVVIDIQKGILTQPTVHDSRAVIDNVATLAKTFREKRLPVVLVRVGWSADFGDTLKARVESPRPTGAVAADFMEYVDALDVDPARDILIFKRQWGAFYGTDLDLQLRRRGVTNIVLCGIATSIGVESTARDAFERGYNLTFAADAMSDRSVEAHDRALQIIFPRIGEIGTTADILAKLPA